MYALFKILIICRGLFLFKLEVINMTTKKSVYKMKTINGDALTPITIYKKLIGKNKFLLESSFQHKIKGKYSYIGLNPYEEIIDIKNKKTIRDLGNGTETTYKMDALS